MQTSFRPDKSPTTLYFYGIVNLSIKCSIISGGSALRMKSI